MTIWLGRTVIFAMAVTISMGLGPRGGEAQTNLDISELPGDGDVCPDEDDLEDLDKDLVGGMSEILQSPEDALAQCRGHVFGIVDTLADLDKQLSDLEAKAKEGDATAETLSQIETVKAVIKRYDESLDIRCRELQYLKGQLAAVCPPPDPEPPGHKE